MDSSQGSLNSENNVPSHEKPLDEQNIQIESLSENLKRDSWNPSNTQSNEASPPVGDTSSAVGLGASPPLELNASNDKAGWGPDLEKQSRQVNGALRRLRRILWQRRSLVNTLKWLVILLYVAAIIGACIGLSIYFYHRYVRPIDYSSLDETNSFVKHVNTSKYEPIDPAYTGFNVVLDAHVHSMYSDGVLNERQIVLWALSRGYTAIAVTDHNQVDGALNVEKYVQDNGSPLIVIPGMEHTSCRMHMNLIGIRENIPLCGPDREPPCPFPTDDEYKWIIQRTHELGGLVFVNHLPWSLSPISWDRDESKMTDHPTLDQLREWGIDGIEVVNGDTFDLPSYQYAKKHNLTVFANTDMHAPFPFYGATVLKLPDTTPINATTILDALKAHSTSIIFDPTGAPYLVAEKPKQGGSYAHLYSWLGFGGYVTDLFYWYSPGMYSFMRGYCHRSFTRIYWDQIGWFIFWCMLIFFLATAGWYLSKYGGILLWRYCKNHLERWRARNCHKD